MTEPRQFRVNLPAGKSDRLHKKYRVLNLVSVSSTPRTLLRYALWLGAFLLLFIGRVTGQILAAFAGVEWLPPMERWSSGLLPYPILLPTQVVIIVLMFWIVRDFARGHGYFVRPHRRAGRIIRWLSILYFAAMLLRYALTMWWHPELRWFTGTIPIWFHLVLASFLFTYSHYHLRQ